AFVDSSGSLDDLVRAIKSVAEGNFYVSGRTAQTVVDDTFSEDDAPHIALSDREFEVMLLLAKRSSVSEIAQMLNLSESTVSTHRRHVLDKMNLTNTDELTRYAVEHELISPESLL
ncbi:MAG: LuxR C-terminal-related transcriptional regulator, partial [Spirochaetota bacterium]